MKTKLLQRSRGAVLLAQTGKTQEEIAARVHASRSLVSHWIPGRRVPSAANRVALRSAYGIPLEAWDEPFEAAPTDDAGAAKRSKAAAEVAEVSVRAQAAQLSRVVRETLERVQAAGGEPEWILKQSRSATAILQYLGKLTGETQEMSEARIVRLPAWRRIQSAIEHALARWPEAMNAVGEELQRIGVDG